MQKKNGILRHIYRFIPLVGIALTVAIFVYGFEQGLFQSTDKMRAFIGQFGVWGAIVFIVFQITQVVLPIMPLGVGSAFGIIIFGPLYGLIYSYVGIVIGSVINFKLTRKYGEPLVRNILSEKAYNRYMGWLDRNESRFDWLFGIAILMPVSPDDILCFLAGLTHMTFKKFILIILLCKPLSILIYSLGLSTILKWILGL